MKKNKIMRLASVLLVAVLLSTCAISGTFAKYVTSDSNSDSARVAKWGVEITTTSDSMFKKSYAITESIEGSSITNSVESTDYVLAPGTNGQLTQVVITGTPEVAVDVTYTVDLTLENWKAFVDENNIAAAEGVEYCPIVFTVGETDYYIGATDEIVTVELLVQAVKDAIEGYSAKYGPGQDMTAVPTPSVSWRWQFDATTPVAGTTTVAANGQNDHQDTSLGNWEINNQQNPSIALTITTTVTQID